MRFVCIFFVKIYQHTISGLFPHKCCFTPTCSEYAITAFSRFGVIKGFGLSFKRIVRCRKKTKVSYDPVPQNIKGDYKWLL